MATLMLHASRNLLRNPGRAVLTAAAVFVSALSLGISLFMADGISEGITRNLVAIESGAVLVSSLEGDPALKHPDSYARVHREILARLGGMGAAATPGAGGLPGAPSVRMRQAFQALLFGPRGDSFNLTIKGIDPSREGPLLASLPGKAGASLRLGTGGVLLSQTVASQLGLQEGDSATVLVNTWGEQVNAVDLTVAGIFTDVAPWADYVAYVPLEVTRAVFGADLANEYLLDSEDLQGATRLADRVRARLAGLPVDVDDYRSAGGMLLGIAAANRYTFVGFSVLLFAVAGMGIASLAAIAIRERSRELATLMALGYPWSTLVRMLLAETVMLVMGALVAAGVVALLVYLPLSRSGIALEGVARNAFGSASLHPALHPYQPLVVVLAGLAAALLGTVLPGRAIARLPVSDALRQG